MSGSRGTATSPLLATAVICAAGVAGLYLLAVRTTLGQEYDDRGLGTLDRAASPIAYEATEELLRTIEVSSLALLGLAIIALALLRGRVALAVAAGVTIVGANVTTQILKRGLDRPPLDGDLATNSFPSGHVTVATSLALALVLVASSPIRPIAAVVGGIYAAAIGAAVLLLAWHRPSDVIGAYLVAAGWCALAAAAAARAEPGPRRAISARTERATTAVAGLLAIAFLAIGTVALTRRVDLLQIAEDRTALAAGVAAAGVGAAATLIGMTTLLIRSRVGEPPGAGA